MALELPSWLTPRPFESPADVLSQASAAAARTAATRLAQQQAVDQNRRAAEELSQRRALAEMEMAQRQALALLNQQGEQAQLQMRENQLAQASSLAAQEEARKAQEAAIRFQGMQELQAELATGKSPREAYLKALPKLTFNSPGAIPTEVLQESFKLGEITDPGIPGQRLVRTGPKSMAIAKDETFLSDMDKARLEKLNQEVERMKQLKLSPTQLALMREEIKNINPYGMEEEDVVEERRNAILDKYEKMAGRKPSSTIPVVRTKSEFDALPPGSTFIGEDGKTYRKP